jgi:membrane-bound lytic murein transglycosylase D
MINDYLHFNQISEVVGIPVEQIRSLNPQYRRDVIPASKDRRYSLVLPQDQISAYIENESTIHDHRRAEFFPNNEIINPQNNYASQTPSDIKGRDKVYYSVKKGDNLGLIAAWHKVRVSDLKYWNKIHKNYLKIGQKLTIYIPEGQGEYFSKIGKMSFNEKQKSIQRTPTYSSNQNLASAAKSKTTDVAAQKKESEPENTEKAATTVNSVKKDTSEVKSTGQIASNEYVLYTVRKGDNFWTIAKKFPGVSNDDIMKLNKIKAANSLKVGQVLKILPKA